jgi:hypothetical protein
MQRLAAAEADPTGSEFSELVFGTPYHGGQRKYHEESNGQVNFLLPGNSWGKTEDIAREALRYAWYKLGPYKPMDFQGWLEQEYKVLVCSYNYNIAQESFNRLVAHHRNRPEVRALIKKITIDDPVQVELANGAIINWGSLKDMGKLVEAARRRVIFVDEVGHIPDLSATFDNILFPRTMGVGGVIHLYGTPKAYSDPYLLEVYEKGRTGGDGFHFSQDGSVFENEFWPQEERDRILNNPRYVTGWRECPEGGCDEPHCRDAQHPIVTAVGRQVIYGHFVLAGGLFFSRLHIGRIFTGDYEIKWDGETHFHEGDWSLGVDGIWRRNGDSPAGRLYMGAFDLAGNKKRKKRNVGSDATVGFVIDYTERPWRIVHYEYIAGGDADWNQKYEIMSAIFQGYPMPYLLIDTTGQVDSVQEALQDRGVEVEGVHFGGSSGKKFDMLRGLQLAMELEWNGTKGVLRSPPIPKLKHELDHYVLPDDDIEQDCVMALAMPIHHIMLWELPAATFGEQF